MHNSEWFHLLSFNCYIIIRNGDSKCFATVCIVLFGKLRCILNRHLGDISFPFQNLYCHLTSSNSKIIIINRKSCNSTSTADTFLTCDDRNFLRLADIVNQLGVVSYGVVSRYIKYIACICCCSSYRRQVIGIRETWIPFLQIQRLPAISLQKTHRTVILP